MLIHLQSTHNHNTLKFIVSRVWIDFIWECKNSFTANKSLLAKKLWNIDGVSYLLFGPEFVMVSKKEDYNWDELSCVVMEVISDYLETHTKVIEDVMSNELKNQQRKKETISEFEQKIIKVLDEKVTPALELHGGFVEFFGFSDGVLKLRLKGACNDCDSSDITLQIGIKNLLQYYFPEILEVERVE